MARADSTRSHWHLPDRARPRERRLHGVRLHVLHAAHRSAGDRRPEVAMPLLIVAFVGLIVGDGLFFYWLFHDYRGLGPVLEDRLALGFIVDALLTLAILTVYFARTPPGRYKWPWFVVLSLLGGLC